MKSRKPLSHYIDQLLPKHKLTVRPKYVAKRIDRRTGDPKNPVEYTWVLVRRGWE